MAHEKISEEFIEVVRSSYLRQMVESDLVFYADVARNALKYMARNTIPITPLHFEVYFIIFSYILKNKLSVTDEWVKSHADEIYQKLSREKGIIFDSLVSMKNISESSLREIRKDMSEIMSAMDSYQVTLRRTKDDIMRRFTEDVGFTPIIELKETLSEILNYGGEIREKVSKTLDKLDELKKKFEELHNKALIDPLTGIYNRGAIIGILENVVNRKEKACIAMSDVNSFKTINDTYGHATGDEVLKTYGRTFIGLSKEYDFNVGRYGGDEFLFIMPGRDLEGCYKVVKSVKLQCEEEVNGFLKSKGYTIISTISFGVTEIKETDTVNSAISRADYLLYKAKAIDGEKIATDDILT